jgi:hypothetical protein
MWQEMAQTDFAGVHGVAVSASRPYTSEPPACGSPSSGALVVVVVSSWPGSSGVAEPSSSSPHAAATNDRPTSTARTRANRCDDAMLLM